MRPHGLILAAIAVAAPGNAGAVQTVCSLPKGTPVSIRLAVAVSSSKSSTGEIFGFDLVRDIKTPSCVVPAAGAEGLATVFLAGASGSSGHEGDLTLRLDYVRTFDEHYVVFDDQRMRINGKNRKVESAVLGFVPFAGYAAGFIRGSDVHLDAGEIVNTVLDRPATFTDALPTFMPSMQPTQAPASSPSPEPSPTQSPAPQPSTSPEPGPT